MGILKSVMEIPDEPQFFSEEMRKLRRAEKLCRMLTETARVYIHYFSVDGKVTYMNKFAEELSGYTGEELRGKNFLEVLVPAWNRDEVSREIQAVLRGQPIENYKAPLVTRRGDERVMLWSGARVTDPDGTVTGMVASGIDITDLEKVENDLHESEEVYRDLVAYDLAALMIVDENGLIFMSRRAEELTEYDLSEIKAKPMWHLIHVDDRERVKSLIEETMKTDRPSEIEEFRLVSKSGQTIAMYGRGVLMDYKGKRALLVSAIDVTELKRAQEELRQSEDLYRTLVDNSLAAVGIIKNGRFVFVNKISEEIVGYSSEELLNSDILQFVHPDDRQLILDRTTRRLRGEDVPARYEFRVLAKNGEMRWFEVHATVIDYQGEKAILANIIDITGRREAEKNRLQTERELALHKQRLYAEAINALTNGKFDVVEPAITAAAMENPRITVELEEPSDVSLSRHMVKDLLVDAGLEGHRLDDFLLAIGEATVNTLKHAGKGRLIAGTRNGTVWVGVVDQGSGMDTFVLTRAVLGKGFSTKPSLGFGYTFIISGSDHVLLATSPEGTSVLMEKTISPPSTLPVNLGRIPDLWQDGPKEQPPA